MFAFVFSPKDISRILYYKNLGQQELWLDCAEKLTQMIQNIIEFAKLIPGFMRLSQDDQVKFSQNILQFHFIFCFRFNFSTDNFD